MATALGEVPPAPEIKFNLRQSFLDGCRPSETDKEAIARHTQEAVDFFRAHLWAPFYRAFHARANAENAGTFEAKYQILVNCSYCVRHYMWTGDYARVVHARSTILDVIFEQTGRTNDLDAYVGVLSAINAWIDADDIMIDPHPPSRAIWREGATRK